MNTDDNAASVEEEVKREAAVQAKDAAVNTEEASTPANAAHDMPATGNSQPDAAITGAKRKPGDPADGHADDVASTAVAGGAAGKKPKPSPAKQSPLEKAAAAKGQQTMSSFFSKK